MYTSKDEAFVLKVILHEFIALVKKESISTHLRFNHNATQLSFFTTYNPAILKDCQKDLYDSKIIVDKAKEILKILEDLIVFNYYLEASEDKINSFLTTLKNDSIIHIALDKIIEGLEANENPLFMTYAPDYPNNKHKFESLYTNEILTKYELIYNTLIFDRFSNKEKEISSEEKRRQ